jgi:hypothetical protein
MREPAFPDVVVAAFASPPGWPSPNEGWMIDNQFWSPPAEWTPRQELEAAPSGWVFWDTKTTEFSKWVAPAMRGYTVMAWFAAVVAVVASAMWFGAAIHGPSPWFLVHFVLVAIGAFTVFFAINMRSRRRDAIINLLAQLAPRHRSERIDAHYDMYLQQWREGAQGAS